MPDHDAPEVEESEVPFIPFNRKQAAEGMCEARAALSRIAYAADHEREPKPCDLALATGWGLFAIAAALLSVDEAIRAQPDQSSED